MATSVSGNSQNAFLKPLGAFFRRFHMILFFVVIAACVATAILVINAPFTGTPTDELSPGGSTGSTDQATLQKIQSLHPSSAPAPAPQLPAGRTNPFGE